MLSCLMILKNMKIYTESNWCTDQKDAACRIVTLETTAVKIDVNNKHNPYQYENVI